MNRKSVMLKSDTSRDQRESKQKKQGSALHIGRLKKLSKHQFWTKMEIKCKTDTKIDTDTHC